MGPLKQQNVPGSPIDITLGVLRSLTKLERLVVALYYYEQLSLEEIATVLKKRQSTVKAAFHRVHQKMALAIPLEMSEPVTVSSRTMEHL